MTQYLQQPDVGITQLQTNKICSIGVWEDNTRMNHDWTNNDTLELLLPEKVLFAGPVDVADLGLVTVLLVIVVLQNNWYKD